MPSASLWLTGRTVFWAGLDDGNVENANAFSGSVSFGLIKTEEERNALGVRRSLVAIKVPKKRLARAVGVGIFFPSPNRPELRVIAFNAFALWQEGFENGPDMQTGVAVVVAFVGVKWEKVSPPLIGAG